MTYNFDPDQWYDMQAALLKNRLDDGSMSRQVFEIAIEELEDRYHQMWKRLDGYFQINDTHEADTRDRNL